VSPKILCDVGRSLTTSLRGDDTIPIFKLMERLREQARAKGGIFLSNLGNHEWMNAIGDWRYRHRVSSLLSLITNTQIRIRL
jgi:hypothetical protein